MYAPPPPSPIQTPNPSIIAPTIAQEAVQRADLQQLGDLLLQVLYDDNVRETLCLAAEITSWTEKSPPKGSSKADVTVFTNNPGRSASIGGKSSVGRDIKPVGATQNVPKCGGAGVRRREPSPTNPIPPPLPKP
jgi:hypothetical protein